MKKYTFNIYNLDCANCALKVEDALKKEGYQNVSVNFTTSKISLMSDKNITLKEIEKIVLAVEPDCKVTEQDILVKKEYTLSVIVVAVLFLLGGFLTEKWVIVSEVFTIISYVLLLYRPFVNAVKTLFKAKTLNENALITISCLGAYLVDQKWEGAMVVILYSIGKILEDKAVNKSRNSIKEILEIKQDYANLVKGENVEKVLVESVYVGDILLIKKGEKIPVDGRVLKGNAFLDTSSLTGEVKPKSFKESDEVLSGMINLGDVIYIKVTKIFSDSTVSKILELINDGENKKAKTETRVAKISKVYTPMVLVLAILAVLFLTFFTKIGFNESLYRGLTFLVISCPCAIAISVPLSYFSGIGICSKKGILIKGSNYLDNLGNVNKIVFDKTGTITKGTFEVKKIDILDKKYSEEEILEIICAGEYFSEHPIAKSIMRLYKGKINNKQVRNFKEISGKGIKYFYKNKKVMVGSSAMCSNSKIDADIHICINGKHVASIMMDDGIKENVLESLNDLKRRNIKTYLFTGDKESVAKQVVANLAIDEVKADLLPQDKYNLYEKIHEEKDVIAFVGDGINDAPLLKRADIGISMGSVGSDAAIEASDIVIMNDDISKVNVAIDISKKTNHIIMQNLVFAITTKILILILSVLGMAFMWLAVFADTGVTLISILNTLRILKDKD